MPWHGDLRAGTGDFLTGEQEVLTGEQKLNGKGVSRLCGLNAEHSSLCGKIIEEGVSKTLCLCVFSVRAFHIYQDSSRPGLRLTHI